MTKINLVRENSRKGSLPSDRNICWDCDTDTANRIISGKTASASSVSSCQGSCISTKNQAKAAEISDDSDKRRNVTILEGGECV